MQSSSFDPTQYSLGGFSFKQIKAAMLAFASSKNSSVPHRLQQADLGLSFNETLKLIDGLLENNLIKERSEGNKELSIEKPFPNNFARTEIGIKLSTKTCTKPKTKKQLAKKLEAFLSRASFIAKNDLFIFELESAYLFGSYIDTSKSLCSDLDIAYSIRRKTHYLGSNLDILLSCDNIEKRRDNALRAFDSGDIEIKPNVIKETSAYASDWDRLFVKSYLSKRDKTFHLLTLTDIEDLKNVKELQHVFCAESGGVISPKIISKNILFKGVNK